MAKAQTEAENRTREILSQVYLFNPDTVDLLADGEKFVFRVQCHDDADLVIRVVPPGASDYRMNSLENAATVLRYLEEQKYQAEQIVRPNDGVSITRQDGYQFLVTRYAGKAIGEWQPESDKVVTDQVQGSFSNIQLSPNDLEMLGRSVGHLHSLPLQDKLPQAITVPKKDLIWVEGELASFVDLVPRKWQAEFQELMKAIRETDLCEGLPGVLLHSDCNPGNVVRTPSGQMIFVDWDGSGVGPAVLDIGRVLSGCFTNDLEVDADAVIGILNGYTLYRRLSQQELLRLSDAMAFPILVLLAAYFPARVNGKLTDDDKVYGMTYPQWQAKYALIEEIAAIASETDMSQHSR